MNMDRENFKKNYGVYAGVKVSDLKHIPEVSTDGYNFYFGLKRHGNIQDIIYICSDYEYDDRSIWYIVKGNYNIELGYSYDGEDVCILIEE